MSTNDKTIQGIKIYGLNAISCPEYEAARIEHANRQWRAAGMEGPSSQEKEEVNSIYRSLDLPAPYSSV